MTDPFEFPYSSSQYGAHLACRGDLPMDTIAFDPSAATLVNVLTCDPQDQQKLLDLLRENIDNAITKLDGWRSTTLVAASDGARVIIISQWRNTVAIAAMQDDAPHAVLLPQNCCTGGLRFQPRHHFLYPPSLTKGTNMVNLKAPKVIITGGSSGSENSRG